MLGTLHNPIEEHLLGAARWLIVAQAVNNLPIARHSVSTVLVSQEHSHVLDRRSSSNIALKCRNTCCKQWDVHRCLATQEQRRLLISTM